MIEMVIMVKVFLFITTAALTVSSVWVIHLVGKKESTKMYRATTVGSWMVGLSYVLMPHYYVDQMLAMGFGLIIFQLSVVFDAIKDGKRYLKLNTLKSHSN